MQFLKKFWNTIRYGDKKLAAYTLLIILLFAGAAVLFASAYTHSSIAHAILGIAMIGLDLFLLSRLVDDEMDPEEEAKEELSSSEEPQEEPAPSWADGVPHKNPSFQPGDAENFVPEEELPEEELPEEEEPEEPSEKKPKKEKKPWNFAAFFRHKEKQRPNKKEKEPKKKKPKGFKKVKVFPKDPNSKEQLTLFLKSYKVKQNHITVLIDNSKKYDIQQCPGYLWKDKKGIHLLLLEETTREILLSPSSVGAMVYKRAVPGDPRKEYLELREPSLKSAVFSSYIPEYYDNGGGGGTFQVIKKVKNLYQIAPDIQFSEKCAKEVMDLLNIDFVVYDQYTKSDKFSEYFKAGHRYQILLRDRVLNPEEYKQKIQNLLKKMTVANIHEDVFDDTIRQMVMYNMIGSDYGEYFRAQRERFLAERAERQNDTKKKKKRK